MEICKMFYEEEKNHYCGMNRKKIEEKDYERYCCRNDIENCPVYQYFFKKYKKLIEGI